MDASIEWDKTAFRDSLGGLVLSSQNQNDICSEALRSAISLRKHLRRRSPSSRASLGPLIKGLVAYRK